MRSIATIVLIALFAAVVCVVTLLDGAVRGVADPDAVVAAADAAGLRVGLVDAVEEYVHQEADGDPGLAGLSRPQLRAFLDGVIAKDWLDATLRRAHGTLVAAVAASQSTALLDLRPFKAEALLAMAELRRRAEELCAGLTGGAGCANSEPARRVVDGYVARAAVALDHAPDQVDLARLVARVGPEPGEARRWLARAHQLAWVGMALLASPLLLLVLLNLAPLGRLLAATGAALLVAAALCLVAHAVAAGWARAEIERRLPAAQVWSRTDPAIARVAPPVVAGFAAAMVDGAAAAARGRLLLVGGAGVVLLGGAVLARRRG